MSFVTGDKEVYKKYNFTVSPVRDGKYIIAKLKIFKNLIKMLYLKKTLITIVFLQ